MALNLNLTLNNVRANYRGKFENVSTNFQIDKTNLSRKVLEIKKPMNRVAEDLKILLQARFNNDIGLLARSIGIPPELINDIISGATFAPPEILKEIEKYSISKSSDIQIGDRVEITNLGNNNSNEVLSGKKDNVRDLKAKVSDLEKRLKDKDKMLEDKDEMLEDKDVVIKVKDQLIASLNETIKLLRESKN